MSPWIATARLLLVGAARAVLKSLHNESAAAVTKDVLADIELTSSAGEDSVSARLPAAGHAASKCSRWDAGRAGFDRNKKSRRDAFKASTAAPPARSSAETFGSGGAGSSVRGRCV